MSTTSPRIYIDLGTGMQAKENAIPSSYDDSLACNRGDLHTGEGISMKVTTLAPDEWLLDGSYHLVPYPAINAHIGWWSDDLSDASGDFTTPLEVNLTFDQLYDFHEGIVLMFSEKSGVYVTDVEIEFYGEVTVSYAGRYYPTGYKHFCECGANDIAWMKIIIHSISQPYRHANILDLLIDSIEFKGSEIKEATVVEEANPISAQLPASQLNVRIFSQEDEFSIVNPSGLYARLQEKQPIDLYEYIDGVRTYFGRYYLDDWKSISLHEMTLTGTDAVGLLEKVVYYGNLWFTDAAWEDIQSEDLIAEIMADTNVDYDLDSSLQGITLMGWIPVTNAREALKQVCFALGAYVTCSRSSTLYIKPTVLASDLTSWDNLLTGAEKGILSPIEQRKLVTGVEMYSHWFSYYFPTDDEIFRETLPIGTHVILFDKIMVAGAVNATDTTCTYVVDEVGSNYMIVSVSAAGLFVFRLVYAAINNQRLFGQYNTGLPSTTPPNILKVEECFMLNSTNIDDVLDRVYNYYQQRMVQKTKLIATDLVPGDTVLVETYDQAHKIGGIVEKMNTDLVKGFISEVEIVGVVVYNPVLGLLTETDTVFGMTEG